MKKVFAFFVLLVTSFISFSQNNRSILKIRLSDGQPLLITINGREFKKVNTLITLGDLPGKRHNIQVYKFRAYADGNGGKAELAYSGDIRIEPGYTYDCIVDVEQRKFLLKKIEPNAYNEYQAPPPAAAPDARYDVPLSTENDRLSELKQQMDNEKKDSKKLELANQYTEHNSLSTADARNIASWIMFDDNKMDFLKKAYPSVTDKNNYAALSDVFTMENAKKEFLKFAKEKR